MNRIMLGLMATAAMSVASLNPAQAEDWYPAKVQVWEPAFNMDSPRKDIEYSPLEKASKPYELCVSFPHMKDAYWLGVNYGVTEEAKRLGVKTGEGFYLWTPGSKELVVSNFFIK